MKKILLFFLLCTGIICAQKPSKREEIPHYFGDNKEIIVHNITDPAESFDIIEITYNNETHQFIRYRMEGARTYDYNVGGLTHWPGCKYCKEYKHPELERKSYYEPDPIITEDDFYSPL